MLSIRGGTSARYLTDQVGAGREGYYTSAVTAGEPAGRWYGKGAEQLGLSGEVDADVMHALYGNFLDPRDPLFADPDTRTQAAVLGRPPKRFRTADQVVEDRVEAYSAEYGSTPLPEQVQAWRLEAEQQVHTAKGYYDVTFSPPKSVSVLHTAFVRAGHEARAVGDVAAAEAWEWKAAQIDEAMYEASRAGLDYLAEHAGFARVGRHGKGATGRWDDAHGLTVAQFYQHTSRDLDPQLHMHQAILNRVECSDGQWRAIDSKALHAFKQGAGAVTERELETSLSRRLGISWVMREDGLCREVDGIDQADMDLFSSRSKSTTARAAELIAGFEARHGRVANSWERDRIRRHAALSTRQAKTHQGESHEEMYDRWDAEAKRILAGGLGRIANRFADTGPREPAAGQEWSETAVIAQAIEACHGDALTNRSPGLATFTPSELTRQILLALPDDLGTLPAGGVRELAERLTAKALASEHLVQTAGRQVGNAPAASRLADGRSASVAPAKPRYAARGHMAAEDAIVRSVGIRGRTCADRAAVETALDKLADLDGRVLAPAQREAVAGIASSDAALAVLVGPAGTGKSYTIGALAAVWPEVTGGRVVGVATAQIAADVLADDGVTDTANVAAFLAAQGRIRGGRPMPGDDRWQLGAGDILAVDEASMLDTSHLTALHATVEQAGARLLLMGDPRQLSAVGAGGMMRTLVGNPDQPGQPGQGSGPDSGGLRAETYTLGEVRRFTAQWERDASLRLRDGDPSVVGEYDARGRLIDAGTRDDAVAAIARAAAADRLAGHTVLAVASSNDDVAEISAAVRRHLVAAGTVDDEGGVILGRDRNTAGVGDQVQARRIDRALGLTNREIYLVTAVTDDGGLQVKSTRTGRDAVMPAGYVATDAALAYAVTAHGAEGMTVDRSHELLTPTTDRATGYVAATRGRDCNTIWAVTHTGVPDEPPTTARGLLAAVIAGEQDPADLSALDVAAEDEQWRTSASTLLGLFEAEAGYGCRERLDGDLDQLVADGLLDEADRARFGADQGTEHLTRLLRAHEQAGADPAALLREAVTDPRGLADAVNVPVVIADRIARSHEIQVPDTGTGIPQRIAADRAEHLAELQDLLDQRRTDLSAQVAEEAPEWAVAVLGPLPDDEIERADWQRRAGIIAAQREASGWNSDTVALGRCPGVLTPEKRQEWHRAYQAAGYPEQQRPEAEMTDGRLLVRSRAAARARAAAPPYVYDAQREHFQAMHAAERDATLARASGDPERAAAREAEAKDHANAAARLEEAAQARAEWLIYQAQTLAGGDAADIELERRGLSRGREPDRASTVRWAANERAADQVDEADQIEDVDEVDNAATAWAIEDDDRNELAEADLHDPVRDSPVQVDEESLSVLDAYAAAWTTPESDAAGTDAAPEVKADRVVSAGAAAAEIRAAATLAADATERLADLQSQDEAAPSAVDDEVWRRRRGSEASQAADLGQSAGGADVAGLE